MINGEIKNAFVCTHTHKGRRVKEGSDECARRRCQKWELYFSLFTWQPPAALEKLHLLVCCVDLHCACIHTWWPPWHLDWRLNKVDTTYTTLPVYLWISSSERESPQKKTIKKKETMKKWKKTKRKNKKILWRCAICWRYKRWHPAVWTSPSRTWWVGI